MFKTTFHVFLKGTNNMKRMKFVIGFKIYEKYSSECFIGDNSQRRMFLQIMLHKEECISVLKNFRNITFSQKLILHLFLSFSLSCEFCIFLTKKFFMCGLLYLLYHLSIFGSLHACSKIFYEESHISSFYLLVNYNFMSSHLEVVLVLMLLSKCYVQAVRDL